MIYPPLDLRTVGLVVALLLIGFHCWGLTRKEQTQAWLKAFPRSGTAGVIAITVVAIWTFVLITTMDLGEFSGFRRHILIAIPIAYLLTVRFVDEFLSVRASGMLLLLGAEPLIEAAFLRPEMSRLLLVFLAYAAATVGMFYVGMPYVLRNQVAWLTKSESRWRASCLAGIAYGVALLFCAVAFYA